MLSGEIQKVIDILVKGREVIKENSDAEGKF
jgi:hypothetical protein